MTFSSNYANLPKKENRYTWFGRH